MASQIQYQVFKAVFDEESRRYTELDGRSKLYLTVITFYLGVVGFKLTDVVEFTNRFHIPLTLYLFLALALLLALLFTVAAARIRRYERICDLGEIVTSFGNVPPTDEDFLDGRLVDLAVATNRNAQQNDRAVRLLRWSSTFIFLSVSLQLAIFLWAISNSRR